MKIVFWGRDLLLFCAMPHLGSIVRLHKYQQDQAARLSGLKSSGRYYMRYCLQLIK